MIYQYITHTLRHFRKYRLQFGITFVGLASGLTACLLAASFLAPELSYVGEAQQGSEWYRLLPVNGMEKTAKEASACSYNKIGSTVLDDFPEAGNCLLLLGKKGGSIMFNHKAKQ